MATGITNKRKKQQRQAILRIVIMAAILVCVNMLAVRFHAGLDLTNEKRFTLTEPTKKLLRNMKDVAVIDVYLKGKFPAGFQRLSESTRERLQSFRDIAGQHIVFRFVNPVEGKTEEEKASIYQELSQRGIIPTRLQVQGEEDGYSEKIVFPFALVQYNGRAMPVRLLENNQGMKPLENLNYSESLLEYKFASAINKLTYADKPDIAYIVGNGESLGVNTLDLLTSLTGPYRVDTFDLVNSISIPPIYKAIIINKPTQPFDDKEKFKIDQYIMNGGHVLWAIDQLYTPMDSLQHSEQMIAMDYGLNLDDQLFKYGVRINSNLIEDMQCLGIPVTVGMNGDKPDIQLRNWIYFPVFIPESKHPIVKNMDAISGMFVNSIDTIANPAIKKTILLTSSKYSRVAESPVRVSLSMLKYPLTPKMFHNSYQPVAVLLEGKFTSVFNNRLHPRFLQILHDSLKTEFKSACDKPGSMIVISDGDMLENDFSQSTGPMEMGYWRYTRDRFANKGFILNCLEYLTDPSGLIEARSKDVRLRLLDAGRVKNEKATWRMVNIGVPVLLVIIFASVYLFYRKRRYESKS